jgi:PAS domain S-box-containing protein
MRNTARFSKVSMSPITEVDLKGDLVLINAAFCRLLGYSESELLGMNNREFQSPAVAADVYQTFNRVYRTGMPTMGFDWQMLRKDGSKVTGEGSVRANHPRECPRVQWRQWVSHLLVEEINQPTRDYRRTNFPFFTSTDVSVSAPQPSWSSFE